MSYVKYGISADLVERVKRKMKSPALKEQMKKLLNGVNKSDLQDRAKVRKLVKQAGSLLGEKLTGTQEEQIVAFVLAQRIDPQNTFHLIKLWGMFR